MTKEAYIQMPVKEWTDMRMKERKLFNYRSRQCPLYMI